MIDFDASEIKNWADMPDAPSTFPKLIANLVLATVPDLSHIDIPGGSSVWMPGWDGLLSVEEGNEWIPEGDVACEFSVGGDPQDKASENYRKRTRESLRIDKTSSTFIFFSPRVWDADKRRRWVERRQQQGEWADVRAYDATDLVNWLYNAPGVADWFARLIGKLPDEGFVYLNDWWENWSTGTQPNISPQLVLAGRTDESSEVMNWFTGPASSFYVQGETHDEAIAFLAASALNSNDYVCAAFMAKAVIVETPDAWKSLFRQRNPTVLIRNFEGDASSQLAVRAGHHVIVPLDSSQQPLGQGVKLPRIGRNETVEALKSMGLSETQARALSRKTARRLSIMRRHLLEEAGAPPPAWASSTPPRSMVTLALIGQWSQDSEGDKAVVAALAGKSYEEVEQDLTPLLNIADTPLTKIGPRWLYVSHEEAWHLLAPYLTSGDVARFEVLAIDILGQHSPAFDLPIQERFMAGANGIVLNHSGTLLAGISRGLALMSTQPEPMTNATDAQYIPGRVVSRVLGDNSDWRTWATLDRHLSTLAESAPEAFLAVVEKTLYEKEADILALFAQDRDPMLTGSPHVGLLRGLECLAWSGDYFSEVAILLARLAEIDPGGAVANRSAASLDELFFRALRFTEATDEHRLQTLSMLLDRYPDIGWTVLIRVFPSRGIVLREPPLWQPCAQDGVSRVPIREQVLFLGKIARLLIENVGTEPARWKDLVGILPELSNTSRQEALRLLAEHADVIKQTEGVESLRAAIRMVLHQHRSYSDAKWAMGSADIDALDAAYDGLQSSDLVEANAWLFASDWIDLPDGERTDDYGERRERIAEAQREAARVVFESGGADALATIIDTVNAPHTVGAASATINSDDIYHLALECIRSRQEPRINFATAYFSSHCRKSGWALLDRALHDLKCNEEAGPKTVAAIYKSGSSADLKTCLERLRSEDGSTQDAYWSSVNWIHMAHEDVDGNDFIYAVERLLDAGRSLAVAELIWAKPVPDELMIRTLEQIPEDWKSGKDATFRDNGYILANLLERLDKSENVPDSEIANLELPLIFTLTEHRPNLALAREIFREPSLFADLITLEFTLADCEYDDSLSGEKRAVQFRFSFELLSNLRGLPGLTDDGTVDSETLKAWVSETRRLCEDRDRKDIGDEKIGEALANAPVGSDGVWPCEAVRDLLESQPSPEHIRTGFRIGRFNQRGLTTRGIFDGGAQERELAEGYRRDAAQITARWPSTAKLLRELADGYEARGRHEDTRATWTDVSGL